VQNIKIINLHQYLYFQIQLWNNFNNKIQNLVINSLPVTKILGSMANHIGTLNSAVCRHGPSMTQAHYTSIIIKHNTKWVRCNDISTSIERWLRSGKDVYIKIMEKKKIARRPAMPDY